MKVFVLILLSLSCANATVLKDCPTSLRQRFVGKVQSAIERRIGALDRASGLLGGVTSAKAALQNPKAISEDEFSNLGYRLLTGDQEALREFTSWFQRGTSRIDLPGEADVVGGWTRLANSGGNNRAVFRREIPGMPPRIVKVFGSSADWIPRLPIYAPSVLNFRNSLSAADFVVQMNGNVLGMKIGSPKVYDFGLAKIRGDKQAYFFIEMEELFPGLAKATLKDFHPVTGGKPGVASWVTKVGPNGKSVLQQIADAVLDAHRKKIYTNDPDIMISELGEVRWIDAAMWESVKSEAGFETELDAAMALASNIHDEPSIQRELLLLIYQGIKNEKDLSPKQLDLLKRKLKMSEESY